MNSSSLDSVQPLILVADDDKIMRQIISHVMEKEGYKVVEAANGEECLAVYKKFTPDIVLLDAMMPVMDGFTCCGHLLSLSKKRFSALPKERIEEIFARQEEHILWNQADSLLTSIERTPVLMITGLEDEESVDRAFEAGATDFVTKPIHWPVLRQRVRRLIQQSRLYRQLEVANQELQRLATLDGLTQVANRRCFDEYLNQEWRRMAREKLPLALVLGDIDFFKLYNDTYGHQAGDDCLQKVAALIANEAKRATDLAARYGGEELAVILPNTDINGALKVAKEIRDKVKALGVIHEASPFKYVSLSLGVAAFTPTAQTSPETLIQAADQALYKAKAQGRDRAIADGE
ncbi:MAG: PleD family two-component system response regulator [Spirulinaceae cyanobacterium]